MKAVLLAFIPLVLALAPGAQADTYQASAEQAVKTGYIKYQTRCTPAEPPQFQSISWDFFHPPGVNPSGYIGGSGSILDASPGLGGPFEAVLDTGAPPPSGAVKVGQWDVLFEFC
jgi:hypothetical protein